MATELERQIARYFYTGGFNCAETVLTILRNNKTITVNRDAVRMMSGFGGGIGKGCVCGAVTGAVAAMGSIYGRTTPSDSNEKTKEMVARFTDAFLEKYPSLNCELLLSDYEKGTEAQYLH